MAPTLFNDRHKIHAVENATVKATVVHIPLYGCTSMALLLDTVSKTQVVANSLSLVFKNAIKLVLQLLRVEIRF